MSNAYNVLVIIVKLPESHTVFHAFTDFLQADLLYSELAAEDTRRADGAQGRLPDVYTVEEVAETVAHICETNSRLLQGSVVMGYGLLQLGAV